MVNLDFTGDLAIIRGDDFAYTFEFQDENCDPIDQTGNTFDAFISRNGAVIENFTVTINTSEVTVSLTDTETTALQAMCNNVKWRLRQTVGGVTSTIVHGDAEVVTL